MERLLARLERRLGRFAIPRLTNFLIGGMALVYVLGMLKPEFFDLLTLDLVRVREGQVWRLVTFLFLPLNTSMLWFLVELYWLYIMGSNLENEWGSFKYNVYWLLGMVGTAIAAALAGGGQGNQWLNLAMVFAFATMFPDYQIYLFFILPIRIKWLALLSALPVAYMLAVGNWSTRAAIIAALGNYFLFFGGHLVGLMRSRRVEVRQAARRQSFRSTPPPARGSSPPAASRTCAICGASEADGADIRVCSCEKCGGSPGRTLCLPHARNH